MSKKISTQEIIDFVLSQPDDREVNLYESSSCDECGCVMVHYGKDVLNLNNFYCGYHKFYNIEGVISLEDSIFNIIDIDKVNTYGELKDFLRKKYQL